MVTALIVITSLLLVVNLALAVLLLRRNSTSSDASPLIRDEFRANRQEAGEASQRLRDDVRKGMKENNETLVKTIGELGKGQGTQLEAVTKQLHEIMKMNQKSLQELRGTVDKQLTTLRDENEKKLDEMRKTVDEKLQGTLEKRLTQSFKLVSEHLQAVQKGLGEMKSLATGVGDLKKMLGNVKARGTWGEVQLGALLEQILIAEQYEKNVVTQDGSREHVEFAIRLPGRGAAQDSHIWLPIDSKFPQEDYLRLQEAAEQADADAVQKASNALIRSIKNSAKEIQTKYVHPPNTTDFAIMFLPTEGLYAEVLRQPGLVEELQSSHRIVVAGPTTLTAILSSLRMGFQTLAIEKRSSEVWKILAAVKTEFEKFEGVLEKVHKQLQTASKTIAQTQVRTRAMERKLRGVEQLSNDESEPVLELPASLDGLSPTEPELKVVPEPVEVAAPTDREESTT
ncbi:MAG: DNA recombination protein RmuC [Myxococcales bacterium]|nr:DNA recombination protein RmuC [Myxococcales bacterium]